MILCIPCVGVRVGATCGTPGGQASADILHMARPKSMHTGLPHQAPRKLALQRATRKAFAQQTAKYRGRQHTLQSLGQANYKPAQLPRGPSRQRARTGTSQRRLNIVTHNLGGLSTAAYDEFQVWLHSDSSLSAVDIVCLQETHWTADYEYEVPKWHVLHSGRSDKSGGLMICVSKKLCRSDQLRYTNIRAGRLQHLRICMEGNSLDVFNFYQHSWNHAQDGQTMLAKRESLWMCLSASISQLPRHIAQAALGTTLVPRMQSRKSEGSLNAARRIPPPGQSTDAATAVCGPRE